MKRRHINTLVIPDIHGRTFWKDAISQFPKEEWQDLDIVFLGDYLDPYENIEDVTRLGAIENFKEIIELAKNDSRVHLLIGNHDMHYWYDARFKSRVDLYNYGTIKDLFLKNFTLFNVAYENEIDGIRYLYTHAGCTSYWIRHLKFVGENGISLNKEYRIDRLGNKIKKVSDEQLPFCKMLKDIVPTAEQLNKFKLNFQGQALLWSISWYRGGDDQDGSCIWADFSEWAYNGVEIPGIFQIFGHSLFSGGSLDEGTIDHIRGFAMLDARQAWCIDCEGNIAKLKEIEEDD